MHASWVGAALNPVVVGGYDRENGEGSRPNRTAALASGESANAQRVKRLCSTHQLRAERL